MAAIGMPELIIILFLIVLVFGSVTTFRRSSRPARGSGRTTLRLIAFGAGAVAALVTQLVVVSTLDVPEPFAFFQPMALIRAGFAWLIVSELIYATRAHLRITTLPAYILG